MPEDNTQQVTIKKRGPYRKHQERSATKPGFILQERDIHILQALWENRFLTRSLIVRLFPPDPERTPAHLRKEHPPKNIGTNLDRRLSHLFHNGLVDRLRTIRGGELIYALAQKGADLLTDHQLPLPLTDWGEKNRDLSNSYLDHTLMTANFRVSLTEAIRQTPDISLTLFQRESAKLRVYWQHAGERAFVLPDAFLILSDHTRTEGQQAFFVEADRSTMKHSRLEQKFLFYAYLFLDRKHEQAFSIPSFKVLTICKSAERASNLLDLVADKDSPIPEPTKHLFYFTSETAFAEHPTNILSVVWRVAADPEQLQAIIGSPVARK